MIMHHIAFWTDNLERLSSFYVKHWQGKVLFKHCSGDFSCVFLLIFGSVRIEVMTRSDIESEGRKEKTGYSHFSIEVESKEEVNQITDYCIKEGIPLVKTREQYDDGFYESAFLDPDGNMVEIAWIDRQINPTV